MNAIQQPTIKNTLIEVYDMLLWIFEDNREKMNLDFSKRFLTITGKNYLDTDAGIQVGITVQLLGNWVIYSEKDSGVFRVLGGNLVQVGGGDPFAPNPDLTYVNILSAASTVVSVSSGSGLSTEEHNKLMSVPSTTLEQEEKDTINLTSEITQMIAANQVMLADLKKLLFEIYKKL